jgi:DNA-binding MarR family transcriptional regulator
MGKLLINIVYELIVYDYKGVNPFRIDAKALSSLSMDQRPPLDALDALLCFNVYSLNRAFGRYYQAAFSETGLTYPKFVILMALEAEGPMSISALSSRAGVEANTLSPLLKKMADFGVITRQRAKDDERRVDVAITPMGTDALVRAKAVIAQGFQELGFDPDQVQKVVGQLSEMRGSVDQADPPKLSFDGLF